MKTTKKQFEYFKDEFIWWSDYFGLKSWQFTFFHEDRLSNAIASYHLLHEGRLAEICFTKNPKIVLCDKRISKSAFHEVCEVMICDVSAYARDFYSQNHIEENVHRIIRRLENTIFEEKWPE